MKPLRMGLVGCGRMGRAHLQAAADHGMVQIAAVVDPAVDPGPHRRLTFTELIASVEIEAVLIAAPTLDHAALVREALAAGKHVLCEKPLTLDPDTDLALEQSAAKRGLILQIGFWRRFAEPYVLLRGILASGEIGAGKALRGAQWDAQPPPLSFCDPKRSGGLEIDCGIHEFDLARWLLGSEIESVVACNAPASSELTAIGDIDTVIGMAQLSGGRIMAIDLTRTAGHHDSIRTELIGEQGSLVAELVETGHLYLRCHDKSEKWDFPGDPIAAALVAQLHAFAQAVRRGRLLPDAAGAPDSRIALIAALALREARMRGGWCAAGG